MKSSELIVVIDVESPPVEVSPPLPASRKAGTVLTELTPRDGELLHTFLLSVLLRPLIDPTLQVLHESLVVERGHSVVSGCQQSLTIRYESNSRHQVRHFPVDMLKTRLTRIFEFPQELCLECGMEVDEVQELTPEVVVVTRNDLIHSKQELEQSKLHIRNRGENSLWH